MKNADSTRTSKETGFMAECAVAAHIGRNGGKILARNYHSRYGEIDIVADIGGIIAFIEVKYRKNNAFGTPAEAVTASKRRKIIKTAQIYINENGLYDAPARFDVAEVFADGGINIFEDAFDLNETLTGGYFE